MTTFQPRNAATASAARAALSPSSGPASAHRARCAAGRLPLGELTRREDRALTKCGGIDRTLKMLPGLPIAHRAQRRQIGMKITARTQCTHLVQESVGDHRIETLRDARVQLCAIARYQRDLRIRHGGREGAPPVCADIGLPVSSMISSARWMRCASLGRMRSAAPASSERRRSCSRPAQRRCLAGDAGAKRGRCIRQIGQARSERSKVEPSAADQQRRAPRETA